MTSPLSPHAARRPVTLITGSTGGIGQALARQLAPTHDLILSARDLQRLGALCRDLNATPLALDLRQPEAFEEAVQGLKRVTNLVHNAGVVDLGPVEAQTHDTWTRTLTVNTVAPAELTRVLLPHLRAEQGSVIFVNSGAGLRANAGWGSYAASKHALKALADALREEETARGLRVTSVYPGRTATEMQRRVRTQEGAPYTPDAFIHPDTVAATIAFALNAPRDATLTDLSVRPAGRP